MKIGDMSDILKALLGMRRGDSSLPFLDIERLKNRSKFIRMRVDKWARPFTNVVHKTEQKRRDVYQGCVSRQTLRNRLRQEAVKELRDKYGTVDINGNVSYEMEGIQKGGKLIRRMGYDLGKRRYSESFQREG